MPSTTPIRVLGDPYTLLGLLDEGEFCNAYYAHRDDPVEMVVVKLAQESDERSLRLLQMEATNIQYLHSQTGHGAEYFHRLLPRLVVRASPDNVSGPNGFKGVANVFGWRSGFTYTYNDIADAYPAGVDARTAVWMLKRTLDQLGWLHRQGLVHGNVTPQHILVHPRDHGTVLCGWSRLTKVGQPIAARSPEYRLYYPLSVWEGGPVSPRTDIIMAVRCLFVILGGNVRDGTLPDGVHEEFANLIHLNATEEDLKGQYTDAWEFLQEVDRVAKIVYGKSKFHPFEMPTVA